MSIELKYGPNTALVGLAAYGAGQNKYRNRSQDRAFDFLQQQQQQQFALGVESRRFDQQQAMLDQRQGFQQQVLGEQQDFQEQMFDKRAAIGGVRQPRAAGQSGVAGQAPANPAAIGQQQPPPATISIGWDQMTPQQRVQVNAQQRDNERKRRMGRPILYPDADAGLIQVQNTQATAQYEIDKGLGQMDAINSGMAQSRQGEAFGQNQAMNTFNDQELQAWRDRHNKGEWSLTPQATIALKKLQDARANTSTDPKLTREQIAEAQRKFDEAELRIWHSGQKAVKKTPADIGNENIAFYNPNTGKLQPNHEPGVTTPGHVGQDGSFVPNQAFVADRSAKDADAKTKQAESEKALKSANDKARKAWEDAKKRVDEMRKAELGKIMVDPTISVSDAFAKVEQMHPYPPEPEPITELPQPEQQTPVDPPRGASHGPATSPSATAVPARPLPQAVEAEDSDANDASGLNWVNGPNAMPKSAGDNESPPPAQSNSSPSQLPSPDSGLGSRATPHVGAANTENWSKVRIGDFYYDGQGKDGRGNLRQRAN
jgi:hypothetical protein